MNKHGLLLFSGGLDSIIAARVLTDQNISLTALHFILPHEKPSFDRNSTVVAERARVAGITLRNIRCGNDFLEMLRSPKHGYGKNMNPCIDCKIYFLRKAAELMDELGASFIATGEVSGQRPMSQRRDMIIHIEREAGLRGKIVRPLCAHDFAPSEAETLGIVDRSKLLSIHGRGRNFQLELAKQWGITDFPSPAGGCALTDPNFARRLNELLSHVEVPEEQDIHLLRIGRHYRIDNCKLILSRNAGETEQMYMLRHQADLFLEPHARGPVAFLCGNASEAVITKAVDTLASYCKAVAGDEFTATISSAEAKEERRVIVSGTRPQPI